MASKDDPRAPPPGWVVFDTLLQPGATVGAYFARGREVRGVCHQKDCRRRCELDLARLIKHGMENALVSDLSPLMRCNRFGGCAMTLREDGGRELTLGMLAAKPFARLAVTCGQCRQERTMSVTAVIARLEKEKTGGRGTSLDKLPELIRGACPACQGRRWRVDVVWRDPALIPRWVKTGA